MIIATRILTIQDAGADKDVPVKIYQPIEESKGYCTCKYEIHWPVKISTSFAAGVDGVQAIMIALNKIGIELYTSSYHKNGVLRWESSNSGFGFPLSQNVRHLASGDDLSL